MRPGRPGRPRVRGPILLNSVRARKDGWVGGQGSERAREQVSKRRRGSEVSGIAGREGSEEGRDGGRGGREGSRKGLPATQ